MRLEKWRNHHLLRLAAWTAASAAGFAEAQARTAPIQRDAGITLVRVSPTAGAASGGTGVTLTGVGLSGALGVTFGGMAATSVNVVNSTTVTAVTPAHAAGAVDVVITTPNESATYTNGYTYQSTALGQSAYGGTIACLNGGSNNLIAATTDNSTSIQWGGYGTTTHATSTTNGATNTPMIVTAVGANGDTPYAAQLCSDYEIDSQGNSPCQSGNTCYNDWFLPSGNNTTYLGQLNCLYTNQNEVGGFARAYYWSSTEKDTDNAWLQSFASGSQFYVNENDDRRVRCVRAFTP